MKFKHLFQVLGDMALIAAFSFLAGYARDWLTVAYESGKFQCLVVSIALFYAAFRTLRCACKLAVEQLIEWDENRKGE